jgi:hypothetical protein
MPQYTFFHAIVGGWIAGNVGFTKISRLKFPITMRGDHGLKKRSYNDGGKSRVMTVE